MCLSGMEAPELDQAELQPYVFLSLLCHRDPAASKHMPLILRQVSTSAVLFAGGALSVPDIFTKK